MDWLADFLEVWLDRAVIFLLSLAALYPAGLALLYLVAPTKPPLALNFTDLLWTSDAGGQMGMGPGLIRMLLLLAGALWLIKLRDLPRRALPALVLAGLFYAVSLASALTSSHPHDALLAWLDLLNVGLVVAMVADLASQRPVWLERLPYAAVFLTLSVIPANYSQFFFEPAADEQMRGAFFHPNIMASYLMLFLPVLLAAYLRDDRRLDLASLVLFGIGASFALMSIALSFSRAGQLLALIAMLSVLVLHPALSGPRMLARGLLAGALGLVATLLMLRGFKGNSLDLGLAALLLLVTVAGLLRTWRGFRSAALRVFAVAAIVAFLLLGLDVGQGKVREHAATRAQTLAQGKDNSLLARLAFWKAAWEIALDHPALGVGPAGFQRYYPGYQDDLNWFSKFTHNLPLTILSETGFTGLTLATLAALTLAGALARRLLSEPGGPRRDVRAGLTVGVGAFLLYSCTDVQWEFRALPMTMAMLLGLALGSPAGDVPEPAPPDPGPHEPLSPWAIRPQVLLQHTGCVLLLSMAFFNFIVSAAEERARYGKTATELRKSKEAAIFYREALSIDPWQGEHFRQCVLSLMGAGLADEKAKKEAVELAEQVTRVDSHRAVGYNLLGRVYTSCGKPEKAKAVFTRALELDPINYPSFYIDLANEALARQDEETARVLLSATVQRFPEETFAAMFDFRANSIRTQLADAHVLLGDLANPVQNPKLAEYHFAKAVALNDKSRLALFGLGVALYHQDRPGEAIKPAQALIQLEPEYGPGLQLAHDLYQQLGQTAEAQVLARKLAAPPTSPSTSPPAPSPAAAPSAGG